MPRHTPYEERRGVFARGASRNRAASHTLRRAWFSAHACAGETRRVCEPGRGALVGGVVKPAPRTHQGLVMGWDIGFGVFRGGMFGARCES
jgi:hypothetical protein